MLINYARLQNNEYYLHCLLVCFVFCMLLLFMLGQKVTSLKSTDHTQKHVGLCKNPCFYFRPSYYFIIITVIIGMYQCEVLGTCPCNPNPNPSSICLWITLSCWLELPHWVSERIPCGWGPVKDSGLTREPGVGLTEVEE